MRRCQDSMDEQTLVDVALNHDAHNACLTLGNLLGQDMCDLGLVFVILLRVAVAAVDHQPRIEALLLEICTRLLDADLIVVCALLSTAQNDKAVFVTNGTNNGYDTRLGDREEVMRVLDRADSIDSDTKGTIRTVLEAHREGQT